MRQERGATKEGRRKKGPRTGAAGTVRRGRRRRPAPIRTSARTQVRRVCLRHAGHGRVQVRGAADERGRAPRPRGADAAHAQRGQGRRVPARRDRGNPAQPCDNREPRSCLPCPGTRRGPDCPRTAPQYPGSSGPPKACSQSGGGNTIPCRMRTRRPVGGGAGIRPQAVHCRGNRAPNPPCIPAIARCGTRPPVRPAVRPIPCPTPACRPSAPSLSAELMPIQHSKPDSPLGRDAC